MNQQDIPACIGIIMDGNRRWARARGLPTLEGHRIAYGKITDAFLWCKEAGIKNLVIYGFSTENWNRSKEEVDYLVGLFYTMVFKDLPVLKSERARIRFIGELSRFDSGLRNGMQKLEEKTKDGTYGLFAALSYGGRAEILGAVKKLAREKTAREISEITEEEFQKNMWTHDMPDPDLIIRPGGEQRLSGFLPWQCIYSELFFTKTLWPDFSREEFEKILKEYAGRERREGK